MQRGSKGREDTIHSGGSFDRVGNLQGFGSGMASSIFGGKDPFDDPFFTRPLGSIFGSSALSSDSPFRDSPTVNKSRGPIIEEVFTDDEDEEEGSDDTDTEKDSWTNAGSNKNPIIELPDDQADGMKTKSIFHDKEGGKKPQKQSASFQRVTYGGINGAYYTATTTRKTGGDGVMLEESRQADKTTGQATHRISRGMHEKGHSVTRRLDSDGKVDTTQTLHNLNEDELAGFEQAWKGNAGSHMPGWDDGFNFHRDSGSGGSRLATWGVPAIPYAEFSGRSGNQRSDNETRSGGRPKKVVTINIE